MPRELSAVARGARTRLRFRCALVNRANIPLTEPDTLDELADWIDGIPACAGVGRYSG